jgi:hypothetical protein
MFTDSPRPIFSDAQFGLRARSPYFQPFRMKERPLAFIFKIRFLLKPLPPGQEGNINEKAY